MERAAQLFVVVNLAVIGLSHVLAPAAWVDLFVRLREKGHAGVLAVGMLSLLFGSIVLALHPVWSGAGLVVTLLGCAHVAKGALYLGFPAVGMRSLALVDRDRPRGFVAAGAGLLILAAIVAAIGLLAD